MSTAWVSFFGIALLVSWYQEYHLHLIEPFVVLRTAGPRQDPTHLHGLMERILVPNVDFISGSKWVLGKYWRQDIAKRIVSIFAAETWRKPPRRDLRPRRKRPSARRRRAATRPRSESD